MNYMIRNASSATARCKRFIAFQVSSLKVQVSTVQIQDSYAHLWISRVRNLLARSRHAQFIHMLDHACTLLARALRGSERALKRIARSVAIVIGISLCLPMSHATSGSIEAIHPKDYVRLILDKREAVCLSRLIGKESAWNSKAIGNLSSPNKVYGLLQLKNPIVKDKSPIEQIHFGLKYIDHRYQGDTCKAWKHWKDKGWH